MISTETLEILNDSNPKELKQAEETLKKNKYLNESFLDCIEHLQKEKIEKKKKIFYVNLNNIHNEK